MTDISGKVRAGAAALIQKAEQSLADATLPERIMHTQLKLKDVDAKLDKLTWSPADKPKRQALMMEKQKLIQDLTGLVERNEQLLQKQKDLINNLR
jgi:hypothetical protein